MQSTSFKLLACALLMLLATAGFAQSGTDRYFIQVDGLACPFCAYGIEKQLMKIDGVAKLSTDVGKGRVVIEMAAGQTLEQEDVEQAVDDAGFTLKGFQPAGNTPENPES